MSQLPESTLHTLPASPAPQSGPVLAIDTRIDNGIENGPGPAPELGYPVESGLANGPDGAPLPQATEPAPQRIPRWLERSELFLRVLLRMYVGLAVSVAPWWPMFWDQNPLFLHFPALAMYAANGAVKGAVSGLGLLNLWIAFRDAVRHRDD